MALGLLGIAAVLLVGGVTVLVTANVAAGAALIALAAMVAAVLAVHLLYQRWNRRDGPHVW